MCSVKVNAAAACGCALDLGVSGFSRLCGTFLFRVSLIFFFHLWKRDIPLSAAPLLRVPVRLSMCV